MGVFDIDACIAKLLQKKLLGEALLREICEKTKEVLMRESNVVHISAPVTVVGDIHGSVQLNCALVGLTGSLARGAERNWGRPRVIGGELKLTDRSSSYVRLGRTSTASSTTSSRSSA